MFVIFQFVDFCFISKIRSEIELIEYKKSLAKLSLSWVMYIVISRKLMRKKKWERNRNIRIEFLLRSSRTSTFIRSFKLIGENPGDKRERNKATLPMNSYEFFSVYSWTTLVKGNWKSRSKEIPSCLNRVSFRWERRGRSEEENWKDRLKLIFHRDAINRNRALFFNHFWSNVTGR